MEVSKNTQHLILKAMANLGSHGATITQIEKRVPFERHTLSKYLSFMQGHGLIYHTKIGKAKVWFMQDAPLKAILHAPNHHKTFTEQILSSLIEKMPLGFIVVNEHYTILYANDYIVKEYGATESTFFYKSILGRENPLKVRKITDLIEHKSDLAQTTTSDINNNSIIIRASRVQNPNNTESFILLIEAAN